MSYHFSKIVNYSFDDAVTKVTQELSKEGFGIVTEIDIKETFKKKINVDFRNYKILGACNPHFAYQVINAEDKTGTMLPCNIVVQEHDDGKVEVSAVDPVASMMAIKNEQLGQVAVTVQQKLKNVIANL
jgi:uncharacterized protein (DUF302 family)